MDEDHISHSPEGLEKAVLSIANATEISIQRNKHRAKLHFSDKRMVEFAQRHRAYSFWPVFQAPRLRAHKSRVLHLFPYLWTIFR